MKRSACLIFNPAAGQSNPEQDLALIREILEPAIDLDIRMTTPEIDGIQLAKEAVSRGVESIIASGGDGTLSAVAGAIPSRSFSWATAMCSTAARRPGWRRGIRWCN